jgi:hypothetical protein
VGVNEDWDKGGAQWLAEGWAERVRADEQPVFIATVLRTEGPRPLNGVALVGLAEKVPPKPVVSW